ncbi:MAG: hypothetical protein WBG50_11410 [Desulfomonilaceae bacterium]
MLHGKYTWQTDALIAAAGLLIVVVAEGYLRPIKLMENVHPLLTAIATGILAASLTSLIIRKTHPRHIPDVVTIEPEGKTPLRGHYSERKFEASEIDMMAVLNAAQLQLIANKEPHQMLRRVEFGACFRILCLDPRCDYVRIRSKQIYRNDPTIFKKRIMESVVYAADIFENLKKETLDISKAGCLEIRITDHPQNIWMYRTDDEILWGIGISYDTTSKGRTLSSKRESEPRFFDQCTKHFNSLWDAGTGDKPGSESYLTRFAFPDYTAELNRGLLKELYDDSGRWLPKEKQEKLEKLLAESTDSGEVKAAKV